jgi:hypothetical protein
MPPTNPETNTPDADSRIQLDPWEELVGQLAQISTDRGMVVVELTSGSLTYPKESKEGELLKDHLIGEEGATVHILRHPDPAEPFRIRVMED